MHRSLFPLLALVALGVATPACAQSTSASANLSIGVTQSQAISSVSLANNSFTGGAASGTVVGTISVAMSPAAPAFSGTLSLSGTSASSFQIVGSNLETNGIVPAGTYAINLVATQAGVIGSPFTQAETITGTSPPASASACPQGTTYVSVGDGCQGAQVSGSWQVPNFFSGYTGTNYGTVRPPWNVAGVDYPIGYSGTLRDPTTASPLDPAHPSCATYDSSHNWVHIGSAPCTLSHYDFTGAGTSHGCVGIYAAAPGNGSTITFDNIHMAWGTACNSTVALLNGGSGGSANIVIQYSQFDDSHSSGNSEEATVHFAGATATVSYSVFRSPYQHAFIYEPLTNGTLTAQYSYVENVGVSPSHGNWDYLSSSSGITFLDQFNTKWAGVANATTLCEMANDRSNWSTTSQYNVEIGGAGVSVLWAVQGNGTNSPATNEIVNNNYFDPTNVVSGFLYATSASAGTVSNKSCVGNINLRTGARVTGTQGSGSAALTCN